eukprot:TRINITY_DN16356_c0_g3_i1.p1 TRINITY_DN16356_c0_g3~~TRINITY_DN16356_c0_g3_i1.p1  ORF type:complete len:687 (-),score=153.55 TRINITY_DN16356_c0_g3_i1:25-2004(-)
MGQALTTCHGLADFADGRLRPRRNRTSQHATYRVRCTEKSSEKIGARTPVRLVVFDLDETLTLITFMTGDGKYHEAEVERAIKINFQTPWVAGDRLAKLKRMLEDMSGCDGGPRRMLAILTKNNNKSGIQGVLTLLKLAGLDCYFGAMWIMPWRPEAPNGAYQSADGTWKLFDPPLNCVHGHKADVLRRVAAEPAAWFPQLAGQNGALADGMLDGLSPESIVLVDDQRANFQSETGADVRRCCKVARYDAEFYGFGLMRDMGGIGAHDDADYAALTRFVAEPWLYGDPLRVLCLEREFEDAEARAPVALVVFDFDETLTLATFMPSDEFAFATEVGWTPPRSSDWAAGDLVAYNFESPFVKGSRVAKLQRLLKELSRSKAGPSRSLAVLTRNECGAVAVLNLLRLANLDSYFRAIWALPGGMHDGRPGGVCQDPSGRWHVFELPAEALAIHKADVLLLLAQHPAQWFPHGALPSSAPASAPAASSPGAAAAPSLRLEEILLVDDERANFTSDAPDGAVLPRYCKVARYDEEYRDCGLLNQMGGLGAHSDEDYERVLNFVAAPWEFRVAQAAVDGRAAADAGGDAASVGADDLLPSPGGPPSPGSQTNLERSTTSEEVSKVPRRRARRGFTCMGMASATAAAVSSPAAAGDTGAAAAPNA